MKEENLFHRRFSLCPNATSPPKIDPPTLTRNLSYGGDNDLCNLSPGERLQRKKSGIVRFRVLFGVLLPVFCSLATWVLSLHLSAVWFIHQLHLYVTLYCGFPPGSETERNSLSMLSHELSPAQSPGSKVRKLFLIGHPLSSWLMFTVSSFHWTFKMMWFFCFEQVFESIRLH